MSEQPKSLRPGPGMAHFDLPAEIRAKTNNIGDALPESVQAARRVVQRFDEEKAQIEAKYMIDSKTGLLNHQGLSHEYDKLKMEHDSRRKSDPHVTSNHSMLFIDMDKFHDINELISHQEADNLLAVVGQFIKAHIREEDKAGRFGGDELIVLLPDTSLEDAADAAERIRLSISQISSINDHDVHPTASIGVGVLDPSLSFEDSQKQADKALYAAKEAGRNQVVVFDSSTMQAA